MLHPYQTLVAALLVAASPLLMATEAVAQTRPVQARPAQAQQGPRQLGAFQSWIAAATQENGQKVCYAFARASKSVGAPPNREAPTLTIAHRPAGRDQVAFSAGFALARNATVVMTVGSTEVRSYDRIQSNAFFDEGAALVAAFRSGRDAVMRTPGPRGPVTDTFPLTGFTAAYEAISRECPPSRTRG